MKTIINFLTENWSIILTAIFMILTSYKFLLLSSASTTPSNCIKHRKTVTYTYIIEIILSILFSIKIFKFLIIFEIIIGIIIGILTPFLMLIISYTIEPFIFLFRKN